MEQNRRPEIEPHIYSHLIFDREPKTHWRKEDLLNKWYWKK
jgi:hypothetical protein